MNDPCNDPCTDTFVSDVDGYEIYAMCENRAGIVIEIGDDEPERGAQSNFALVNLTFAQAREFSRQLAALLDECDPPA